ncbi:MAG: HIT domain-containing protein [Candidatus Aenigmatarchaeota archaeon]
MEKCVFCNIVKKLIPSNIIYEDEATLAFLDINPRSVGMSIVIPKQHYQNFDENLEISTKVFSSALKVAEMIKKSLRPRQISFSVINSEIVPHFHVRIYPIFEKEIPLMEAQPIAMSEEEIKSIANKIREFAPTEEKPREEKVEEEKKEEERSEEETYWIKRKIQLA